MKKNTSVAIMKFMVKEVGIPAGEALDVAAGPRMVRILLNLGADPCNFTYFNSEYFVRMPSFKVADDTAGADTFRRSTNLFPALGIRLLAGATLPPRLEEWFNWVGRYSLNLFMTEEGTPHMTSCYTTALKLTQGAKSRRREALVAVRRVKRAPVVIDVHDSSDSDREQSWRAFPKPSPSAFLSAYANYAKFLPVKLYVFRVREGCRSLAESAKKMRAAGLPSGDVDAFTDSLQFMRSVRCLVKGDVTNNALYATVQRILDIPEDGVCMLVMSFL